MHNRVKPLLKVYRRVGLILVHHLQFQTPPQKPSFKPISLSSKPPFFSLLLNFSLQLPSSSSSMDPQETSLRQSLAEKQAAIDAQANTVRELKASGTADKSAIDAALEALKGLKISKASIEDRLKAIVGSSGGGGADDKEAFRQSVSNTLERKLFYIPSFKIYRGVAGLYDYGPPGCAVKQNVLAFWRQV